MPNNFEVQSTHTPESSWTATVVGPSLAAASPVTAPESRPPAVVEAAPDLGIGILTLFAFSSTAGLRPNDALMRLMARYLEGDRPLPRKASRHRRRDPEQPSGAIARAEANSRWRTSMAPHRCRLLPATPFWPPRAPEGTLSMRSASPLVRPRPVDPHWRRAPSERLLLWESAMPSWFSRAPLARLHRRRSGRRRPHQRPGPPLPAVVPAPSASAKLLAR
jgi:hypothetical protein